MSQCKNGSRRCDWCGKISRNKSGEYQKADGSFGTITSPDWDKVGAKDICEECSVKHDPHREFAVRIQPTS